MDESLSDLTQQKDQYEKKMGWLEWMKDIFLDEEDVETQWDHLLTMVESIKQELAIARMDQKEVGEDMSMIELLAFRLDMLADWVSRVGMCVPPPQIKAPNTAWNEAYIMLVSCIDYALDMTCIQSVSQCFIVGGIL